MIKLGIIMDPISKINIKKDSSFAMLLEAQRRNYEIHYMEIHDLWLYKGIAYGRTRSLNVRQNIDKWFLFDNEQTIPLSNLDVILMRKDPPFDIEFIYITYILEFAEEKGVLVINKPKSLRDCNEKLFTSWFSELTPDTLVSRDMKRIRDFLVQYGDIILKPLGNMGGFSIFRVKQYDPNVGVIIETITNHGRLFCMAQKYLPEIKEGDKRVLVIDGIPVPYCLARIPKAYETRGNLSVGGIGKACKLSKIDLEIAHHVGPVLKERGIVFAGLDIIGNKLIEINITSPTCLREIESAFSISITGMLMDAIEKYLQ